MSRFLLTRVLHGLISLLGLVVAVFFLARLTGNPADLYLPSDASVEIRAEFAERLGYNDPLPAQFGRYAGGVLHLDFGQSLREQRPAMDLVLEAFPKTLLLAIVTMGLAVLLAIPCGVIAAARQGKVADRAITFVSLATVAAPNF